jgi:predicted PurR-regulated permease PerM
MAKKPIMGLGTINTILNTAPIVIQGATRLIKLIRDQGNDNKPEEEIPETIEGIKNEVDRLHQRLDTNDESNVEQIKLIEELAKQNESLATQLKSTITHLNRITVLASIAILISIVCLTVIINI